MEVDLTLKKLSFTSETYGGVRITDHAIEYIPFGT